MKAISAGDDSGLYSSMMSSPQVIISVRPLDVGVISEPLLESARPGTKLGMPLHL